MATSTTAEQTIDVVTPAAGESVTEGTILEWHAKVGEQIKVDDTIVEISTDKVDVELPSPATGTVTEILVAEGDTVTVGQVIARIAFGDGAAAPAPAGTVALGHTECDVVRGIGAPDAVNISKNPRGDRVAVVNFSQGARAGIYTFTAGRLTSVERGAEPVAEPKPTKPKKKKPAAAPAPT